jgi:DNA-binding MarR family transcriptional regulator
MYDLVSDDIVARMWTVLHQASDAASRAAAKRFRPLGVSFQQVYVLLILARSASPPTGSEISRIVMRKPHTVTALLNGMQRAGLIKRVKDKGNQKLVRIVMTEKGKQVWEQVMQTPLSIEFTSFLSIREFHELVRMLENVRDAALRQSENGPL